VILLVFAFACTVPTAREVSAYDPGRANFSIVYGEEVSEYHTVSTVVMPGETLRMNVTNEYAPSFELQAESGSFKNTAPAGWVWTAPNEPGIYVIQIVDTAAKDTVRVNAIVLVPATQQRGEYLNGYRIGYYPRRPLGGREIYLPPAGFIEVTPENQDTWLTPHFQLKQFYCKQADTWPRYVLIRPRLLLKLELILEKVNDTGYPAETLTIMSGFRTPYYNRSIGNVQYSRHLWGGAADIYVDTNGDGKNDDLNHDGRCNYRDAVWLYDLIDEMAGESWYRAYVGGMGAYRPTARHGGFVHIDVRGNRARW
jgi:hypothetical protein